MIAIQTIRDHIDWYRKTKDSAISINKAQLKDQHPVLSRIPEWVERKCSVFSDDYSKKHPVSFNEWTKTFKGQEQYLYKHNLDIEDQVERKIVDNTYKKFDTFEWNFRIWRPSHWKKEKHTSESGTVTWTLNKYRTLTTSTNYPGWRFGNIVIRIGQYINNGLFGLIANCIYGPFGFRSWVGLDEFQPDRDIDIYTGELKPVGSKFATWFGRIRAIWQNIAASRTDFEKTPDTGFFGKSFTRPFHLLWNYIGKGVFGSTFAFAGHLIFGMINAAFSICATVASPAWSIVGAVGHYLVDQFIYDLDKENGRSKWFPLFSIVIKDFLVKGLCRIVLPPVVAIGNAALGVLGYAWSGLRFASRQVWDFLMFHIIVKNFGRVPDRNGLMAKRIKGPGLSMEYYQIVKPDFAVLMTQYQLEKIQVSFYKSDMKEFIDAPSQKLLNYFNGFHSVGLSGPTKDSLVYSQFQKRQTELTVQLEHTINSHFSRLVIKGQCHSSKLRFTRDDLQLATNYATDLCKTFCDRYPEKTNLGWWTSYGLVMGDYSGLAMLLLKRSFGDSILQPIEDTDKAGFRIEIDHNDIPKYAKMIYAGKSSDFIGDLERQRLIQPAILDSRYPAYPDFNVITPANLGCREQDERLIVLEQIQ